MANGLLACYDMDGNEIWKKDLQKEYGVFDIQFGLSSSPLLDGDRLYVQLIHGPWNHDPHKGLIVALDKKTGNEIWKHERVTDAIDECKHSYTSPVLYEDENINDFSSLSAPIIALRIASRMGAKSGVVEI